MTIFASMSIGLLIMSIALLLIRKEVNKASFFKHVKVNRSDEVINDKIISIIQSLENKVDEMNQSFYDIVSDLEGKFSVHEKEIQIVDQGLSDVNVLTKELAKLLNYQGKEIATIKKFPDQKVQNVEPSSKTIKKPVEQDSIKEEILKLKALGMDDQQIAKYLGKGVSEIKMLMAFIK